jgi:hypothetical protein
MLSSTLVKCRKLRLPGERVPTAGDPRSVGC